jgi:hypothetical protein
MEHVSPNLNEGKPWSEMDLTDLKNAIAFGRSVADIADFLCRSEDEVREKIAELEKSAGAQHDDSDPGKC